MIPVSIEIAPSARGGTRPDVALRNPVNDWRIMLGMFIISLFLDATEDERWCSQNRDSEVSASFFNTISSPLDHCVRFSSPIYRMPRLNIRNLIDRLTDVLAEITEAWADCVNVEIGERLDRQRIMIERIIETLEILLDWKKVDFYFPGIVS